MKIKLTTLERLAIPSICPAKDNIDRLLIRKSILEKVELKPEEATEIGLTQEGTNLAWNKNIEDIEAELSEIEVNYMRNCINELSNKKELHASMIELYQKIKA